MITSPVCASGRRNSDFYEENPQLTILRQSREIEDLRDRVRLLEKQLGYRLRAPLFLGLTPDEEIMFGLLATGRVVTPEMFKTALYADEPEADRSEKLIAVKLSRLRAKLFAHGFVIENIHGRGYRLTPATVQRLKQHGVAA